ncbi:MAG: secondary thiamine-phosphate synthase enzyme [Thaumarchaeota archaeon]|jgi:secondary thiamine-phosphate synthase enzyme|nr:secondary thiamine-phosphate synthase enzyme [Nitrososphaerota archaeon]|tara:strand:+ start:849 stop:1268 length:420 start_codon:yes stop_codon:yes gene_type:complete
MQIFSQDLNLKTCKETDIVDITQAVVDVVKKSDLSDGIVTIFVPGSTGAVTTIEYEPGLRKDFPAALERLVPKHLTYEHEKTWHDGNGHSHVRASLLGPSLTVPFRKHQLLVGTWQQIVFVELDIRSRSRNIVVQVMGE